MSKKYTPAYFLDKFKDIDEKEWGSGSLQNKCVLYHLGLRNTYSFGRDMPGEIRALISLFGGNPDRADLSGGYDKIFDVNDSSKWGTTPKKRVINKLKSLL